MGVELQIVIKGKDESSGAISSVNKSLEGIGQKATTAGKWLTAGLTLPIVGLGVKALMAASDIDESINKVSAEFGKELLPVVKNDILPVIQELLGWFKNLSPEMKRNIVVMAGLAAAAGPVLMVIGSLLTVAAGLGPVFSAAGAAAGAVAGILSGPLVLAVAGLALQAGVLYAGWKLNFFGIRDTVQTIFQALGFIFSAFKKALTGDWRGFGEDLRNAWDTVWKLIQARIQSEVSAITGIIKGLVKSIQAAFNLDWGELGRNIINGIVNALLSGIEWVIDAATNVATAIRDVFKGFFGIQSPSKVFEGIGQDMLLGLMKGFQLEPIEMKIRNTLRKGVESTQQAINNYTYNTYNLAYQTSQTSLGVASDIKLLELLRG